MENWLNTTGLKVLGWVALAVGIVLIIAAVAGIGMALTGKEKDWKKALENLAVGLVGGLLGWWGASQIISFMKKNGQEIPHS